MDGERDVRPLLIAAIFFTGCAQQAPPPASLHSCAVIVENDNGAYCDGTLCLAKSAVCMGQDDEIPSPNDGCYCSTVEARR